MDFQTLENKLEKWAKNFWLPFLLIASIPLIWALFVPGYYGASDDLHIAWLYQMDKVIKIGQIPPRFVPDLSYGFGYPLFNFVFPLPFYIAELFHLFGLNFVDSIKFLFLLTMPLSMISMFLLMRKLTFNMLSLFAAVVYGYTPYRATDLYVRGAIGEIVTFVLLPLVILSMVEIWQHKKNYRWIGVGGLSVAGVILSHNITAYMFFPLVVCFPLLIIYIEKKNNLGFVIKASLSILLGALVSIYFWLPAIKDSRLMKYDTVFNFADHYPTLKQLFSQYFGYGASVAGPHDGMSFSLGFAFILLFAVGIFFTVKNFGKFNTLQRSVLLWSICSCLIALFMMNFRSMFVWERVPMIAYFQFPWRFLILTTFASPLLVIALNFVKKKNLISAILIAATVGLNFSYFRPQDFLGRKDAYYLDKYIPTPVASDAYRLTQEEYLRSSIFTNKRPESLLPRFYPESSYIKKVTIHNDLAATAYVDVDKKEPLNLSYNKYFFPGWEVVIDDKLASIGPGVPYGQVNFNLDPGFHRVEVSFKETPFNRMVDLISLLTLFFVFTLVLTPAKLKYEK